MAAAREKAREKQEKPADVNSPPVNDVPDETMELRTKQTVSYSENSWHVPFSQMVGTTSRAAERAVNTVLGCIGRVAKTPARESALMQELVSHSRFQAALQASGMPSRADWLIAEGVASELAHYRENNLHKTQHGRIANNAIARAAVSKLREVAVHGDFTLVRQVSITSGFLIIFMNVDLILVYLVFLPGCCEQEGPRILWCWNEKLVLVVIPPTGSYMTLVHVVQNGYRISLPMCSKTRGPLNKRGAVALLV